MTVVLTRTDTPGGGPGAAAKIESPMRLEIDKATMQLVEVRGAERCAYTRVTEPASGKQ